MTKTKSVDSNWVETLKGLQKNNPDHRFLSDTGYPFPEPINGAIGEYYDIEYRQTLISDIPSNVEVVSRRKSSVGKYGGTKQRNKGPKAGTGILNINYRSKIDFGYMSSGNSLAIRICVRGGNNIQNVQAVYDKVDRMKKALKATVDRQRKTFKIDDSFQIGFSYVDLYDAKEKTVNRHLVVWRIDGTRYESII